MKFESAAGPLETKAVKANVPAPLAIENLPTRLDFPSESPSLVAIKEELLQEMDKPLPRDRDRLEELSTDYEETAVALVNGWQDMRLRLAIIGALIKKGNVFGQAGCTDYQIDALFQAWEFAKEMQLDKTADIVIKTLGKLPVIDERRELIAFYYRKSL